MGIIITSYHQGRIIEKRLLSDNPHINKYVIREEITEKDLEILPSELRGAFQPKTRSFLDERDDLQVGDYVDVYLVTDLDDKDSFPRTILIKRRQ
jgi:hypothetical protein